MLLDVLKGWQRDGVDVSRDMLDTIADPMEQWAVLLEVLMVSGFFGPGQKAKMTAILKALEEKQKRETPTSE